MRHSLLFQALCSTLDEIVTFNNLFKGGVEFNPRVAWLISINPLLYPLADIVLITAAWVVDKLLIEREVDLWFLWTTAGVARLFCVALSLGY